MGIASQAIFAFGICFAFLSVTLRASFSATGLVIGFTGLGIVSLPYLLVTAVLAYEFAKILDRFSWANILCQKSNNKVTR